MSGVGLLAALSLAAVILNQHDEAFGLSAELGICLAALLRDDSRLDHRSAPDHLLCVAFVLRCCIVSSKPLNRRRVFMKGKFRKFFIAACIISPFVFFGVMVVLADVWSGPANRTDRRELHVIHKHNGSWVCSEPCGEPEYNICTAACANRRWMRFCRRPNNNPPATVHAGRDCLRDNLLQFGRRQRLVQGNGFTLPERERACQRLHIKGFDSTLYGPLCSARPVPGTSRKG